MRSIVSRDDMLARYSMVRGAPASALPPGTRQDTRMHTRHVLRPEREMVERLLADATNVAEWTRFATQYRALVTARRDADPRPFDAIAALARQGDVLLGCSCPTAKNPDVRHCHTVLALELMRAWYPDLDVRTP
jgi:hypothetical protein